MLWLLQTNFFREAGYARLIETLSRLSLPYVVVKPVPFTQRLVRADVDTSRARVDVDELPDVELDAQQPIVTMGSYTLARMAAARGYRPGAWLDGLDYTTWSKAWQPSQLLNPNARVCRFGDADFDDEVAFVRPVEDSKAFAGKVFERGEWRGWKRRVLDSAQPGDPLTVDTEVLIAQPVSIFTETRCWVVDRSIVTVSGYKRGKHVVYTPGADDEVVAFAQQCIEEWVPNNAFVLDVAQTPAGCKVVEVNCLNAAGFYAADVLKLVSAIETRFG
jgi:hypothetical protein